MNIWGIWVKDVHKFFVLFLQLFSPKSEIIQKLKAFQKKIKKNFNAALMPVLG